MDERSHPPQGRLAAPRRCALQQRREHGISLRPRVAVYTRELAGIAVDTPVKVRDVVNKQDVTVKPGAPIQSNVPRHGVSLYVVTYPAATERGEL